MKNLAVLLSIFACASLYAHSGGTDANGCHTESATGYYHCSHEDTTTGTADGTTTGTTNGITADSTAAQYNPATQTLVLPSLFIQGESAAYRAELKLSAENGTGNACFTVASVEQRYSLTNESSGFITNIVDGDTVDIYLDSIRQEARIRIAEIDAPELTQLYGAEAKDALGIISGKEIELKWSEKDEYGRIIGRVFSTETNDVSAWMVANGHAWVYTQHSDDPSLPLFETAAREAGLGLWASLVAPIPPWDFRNQ